MDLDESFFENSQINDHFSYIDISVQQRNNKKGWTVISNLKLEEKIIKDLLPQEFGKQGKIWVISLIFFVALGLFAYGRQLYYGLEVTAMRDYASWGIYISNFVFFVAISLVGSLITAVLRLTDVKWSTPLTRIAEIIAVSAITFASIIKFA